MEKTLLRSNKSRRNNDYVMHIAVYLRIKPSTAFFSSYLQLIKLTLNNTIQAFLAKIHHNYFQPISLACGIPGTVIPEIRLNNFSSAGFSSAGNALPEKTVRKVATRFQSLRLNTGYFNPEGHGAAFKVLYYVKELVKWQKK